MGGRALYEVFARHWAPHGLSAVPDSELDRLAELGFDYLWVMGVWTTGAYGRDVARSIFAAPPAPTSLDRTPRAAHAPSEIESSPYAIARYVVDPRYGGNAALADLRRRLAQRHIGLILDFVPNHTARDHDWITSNPDVYVHDESGIACGKDPYFPPWTDTAQLDHRLAATWVILIETLQTIATQCDGVRCDMAMLVLSDVFARTWAHAPPRTVRGSGRSDGRSDGRGARRDDELGLVREEFWAAAIGMLPASFIWIAEAYWGLEGRLQALGFDFTYDKALYDHLVHGDASQVRESLRAPADYQRRSLRFLENHDEPRLAHTLTPERAAASLAITLTAPGLRFVHDGQIEGRRAQATIQLAKRPDETRDAFSEEVHHRLLAVMCTPAVRDGDFAMLATDDDRLVAYRWEHRDSRASGWHLGSDVGAARQHPRDDAATAPRVVVIVNFSAERVRSQVTLDLHGTAGRRIALYDVMDDATYERNGGAPLYVDLRPWQAHVFTVTTMGLWHG